MHASALDLARRFFELYAPAGPFDVLDIGSADLNGSMRSVAPERARYFGVDLEDGPGVDLAIADPHELPFPSESFDQVVTSSCLEHDWAFWATVDEAVRVLKPGGYLYINAPSDGLYHSFPIDCWRFYPDSGLALCRWVNRRRRSPPVCELVESFVWQWLEPSDIWNDTVIIIGKTPVETRVEGRFIGNDPRALNWRRQGREGVGRYQELPSALHTVAMTLAYLGQTGDDAVTVAMPDDAILEELSCPEGLDWTSECGKPPPG